MELVRNPAQPPLLNLFCMKEGEAWRVHVAPIWLPRYLESAFDRHGEAYPVYLDWDDLERHMQENGATFEKQVSRAGSVELTARDSAAEALAVWLSTAIASGVRTRPDDTNDGGPALE